MTDDDLQPLVAANYMTLADLLDALPPERWDTPSLELHNRRPCAISGLQTASRASSRGL